MGARKSIKPMVMLSVALLACACGNSDESARTLTASDVSNLPPGNAVGTSFSGVYVLDHGMISACDCRIGSCTRWSVNKGNTFTLTETDGALKIILHSNANATDQIYNGGIQGGGEFRVGSSQVTDSSTSYSLITGTVVAGMSIAAESRNTFRGQIGGDDFDCDLTATLAIPFLTPLP